ncbi:MAG: hypothetical protein PWQ67_2179 [Clostridia bacterium]|nr:hypothetical protein [Clostridia bacterium]
MVRWYGNQLILHWSQKSMRSSANMQKKKGIRVSPWVNAKMKDFIEESKQAESEKTTRKGRS